MGIYGEITTDSGAILDPYRKSAKIIGDSDLNYTIIHPAWFTYDTEIDYQLVHKDETFPWVLSL